MSSINHMSPSSVSHRSSLPLGNGNTLLPIGSAVLNGAPQSQIPGNNSLVRKNVIQYTPLDLFKHELQNLYVKYILLGQDKAPSKKAFEQNIVNIIFKAKTALIFQQRLKELNFTYEKTYSNFKINDEHQKIIFNLYQCFLAMHIRSTLKIKIEHKDKYLPFPLTIKVEQKKNNQQTVSPEVTAFEYDIKKMGEYGYIKTEELLKQITLAGLKALTIKEFSEQLKELVNKKHITLENQYNILAAFLRSFNNKSFLPKGPNEYVNYNDLLGKYNEKEQEILNYAKARCEYPEFVLNLNMNYNIDLETACNLINNIRSGKLKRDTSYDPSCFDSLFREDEKDLLTFYDVLTWINPTYWLEQFL